MAKRLRSSWISTAEGEGYEDVSTLQGQFTDLTTPLHFFLLEMYKKYSVPHNYAGNTSEAGTEYSVFQEEMKSVTSLYVQPHPSRITHIYKYGGYFQFRYIDLQVAGPSGRGV